MKNKKMKKQMKAMRCNIPYYIIKDTRQLWNTHTLLFTSIAALCLIFAACSTTKNLPEDETLYTGIKKISYTDGSTQLKNATTDSDGEGVITSLADAYSDIEDFLAQAEGTRQIVSTNKKTLTKEQKDSIAQVEKIENEAYATAKTEVNAALAYPPNNAFFGSSSIRTPLPTGLWIYNAYVGKTSRFGKWMFNTFAATPVYISTVNPETRALVAQNTLRNYGYFNGTVGYEVIQQKNPKKAKVSYTVNPRDLFRLDSIAYLKFPAYADSLIQLTWRQRNLKSGDPFSVINLDAERTRLYELFRNSGYYYYKTDYITFRADTIQRPGFVQLQVLPADNVPDEANRRYYIGTTTIRLYNNDTYELTDSVRLRDFTYLYKGDDEHRPPLRFGALRRNLFYRQGSLYRQNIMSFVQEQLSDMDVFSTIAINYTPADTAATNDTLNIDITAVLDKPYDGEFTTKVTSKSNGQIGPGLSFSLSKRNAFRGAEKLKFEVYGSYEWQTSSNVASGNSVINSYEYGTSLTLEYPRLIFPGAHKIRRRASTSTEFTIDASWMNRADYFGMVSVGASLTYTYQSRPTIKHEFTPFSIDYDHLLSTTTVFDSIMAENEALYISMRDQLVPSMSYTFTYSSPRKARNPSTFILTVKESGNILSALYAMCGKSFKEKDKKLFNVPFAQYLRFEAEYRQEFRLTPSTSIATRIGTGAVFCYGNSTNAPYSDLFSVGGANSIRAFSVRGVGPGHYVPGTSEYSYIDQMGDFKIELNAELRFPIISMLSGAVFIDAGNVWLMDSDPDRPGGTFDISRFGKDLALGTGFGVRCDLDFLILRFDIGIGIHAPYDTGKSGYYNMVKFNDSLGYHFAVGYPF